MALNKLVELTADGDSAIITLNGETFIHVYGDFGGGTLTFHEFAKDGTPIDSLNDGTAISYTAPFASVYSYGRDITLGFTLTGATNPALFISLGDS